MRLALIIDDYLPHSTRVGAKMFHELAVELFNSGHDVTVITPTVEQKELLSEELLDGVKVWRFRSGPIKDVGKVLRAVNETLLSSRAWTAVKHKIGRDSFDGVVYYSPSIFFGGLVAEIKKRCACPAYLVLRDLFPQWVIDAGMIKEGSLIEKYFRFFEHYSYRQADIIGLMSEKNLEVFEKVNSVDYPTHILRNWAALKPHMRGEDIPSIRQRLNLQDKVIYFYGGNIGYAQDMANLMRLAKGMQKYENAHFLFIGQGDEVELIQSLASEWKLSNFSYFPSVKQDEFKSILSEIDVGLFSLSPKHSAHNFPGKLLGYMGQSIPILGSVNEGNDLLELVNSHQAGYISINGQDGELLSKAVDLYHNQLLRESLGENAFNLLSKEFSVESIAKTILEFFNFQKR